MRQLNNPKLIKRFKEFIETYPEEMRYKVAPVNCISLMHWSYEQGKLDLLEEIRRDFINVEMINVNKYIDKKISELENGL